eukprot:gene11189-7766_t
MNWIQWPLRPLSLSLLNFLFYHLTFDAPPLSLSLSPPLHAFDATVCFTVFDKGNNIQSRGYSVREPLQHVFFFVVVVCFLCPSPPCHHQRISSCVAPPLKGNTQEYRIKLHD